MAVERATTELLDQVITLAARLTDEVRVAVRELDLTEPVANLLWLVDPDAGPLPLRQIADRLHCDPSNVTLLAAKLEEKGLAQRRPHPRDGRVRTLVLTEAGIAARAHLIGYAEQRSPFAALSGPEQRTLRALLTKALNAYG